jgi:predicted nucleic acid-binding protein
VIVLDSCAYIDALDRVPGDPLRRRIASVSLVHVPDGFDIEVFNVLRRLSVCGKIGHHLAAREIAVLASWAEIERHSVVPLLASMWRLRQNVTGYDAAYVALAARLNIPMVTTDAKLSQAPNLPCTVEVF